MYICESNKTGGSIYVEQSLKDKNVALLAKGLNRVLLAIIWLILACNFSF